MSLTRTLVLAGAAAAFLSAGGCAALLITGAAAAGAGTMAHYNADFSSMEEVTFDEAWDATRAAIDELELVVIEEERDAMIGRVRTHSADDREIRVDLRSVTDGTTEITVRVGTFGDEERSLRILDTIRSHF